MKIQIEIDCGSAVVHDYFEEELLRILDTASTKLIEQLERDKCCVCELREADYKLIDINGSTVGSLKVVQ